MQNKLINYCVIAFSFILIFTIGFPIARWLLYCFCLLAESYETINHNSKQYLPHEAKSTDTKMKVAIRLPAVTLFK